MNPVFEDYLMHYGMPMRSGRYPWGSGENPYQHSGDFLSRVHELKKEGKTEKEIATELNLSVRELRDYKSIALNERRLIDIQTAVALRDKGLSPTEIGKQMGKNESSIRSMLASYDNEEKMNKINQAKNTADILRAEIDSKGMIDVGTNVELSLGVTRTKLDEALRILENDGYKVYGGSVPQVTNPGRETILKVIGPPETEHKDIYDYENVHQIGVVSHDGGETFDPKWVYPKSMDSSRLAIRYGDEGGSEKDGVIELRRGVEDLDLGDSHYAQVRILVDGTHYIKGMAMYSDDLPEGVDVLFNTNKSSNKSKLEVLKPIETKDPDNPFGSLIKEGIVDPRDPTKQLGGQSYYYDKNGNKQLSLINKRAEEGDWKEWSDTLPSQFLSKQDMPLIEKQLRLSYADKVAEFDEIKSLTNPTIKRKLLDTYADECDAAAVHLKAAALPRQKYQVILPIDISDKEVYAPNYRDGETVALVRFPHAGPFEIPILKVNNKLDEGIKKIGTNPKDAIGINSKVAAKLSGADFDGDTVMVIPCNSSRTSVKIKSKDTLRGLEDFDPKASYPEVEGMRYMKNPKTGKDNTQNEMGVISNLITDMYIKGATDDELARAVRHSMVVIDAAKHKLNYKQSEIDNNIAGLKKKYQGKINEETGRYNAGASTLISRASSQESVLKRRGSPIVNPDGSLTYKTAHDKDLYWTDEKGKVHTRTQKSTKMAETKDAYALVSDYRSPKELAYAEYANSMKDLAKKARVEKMNTPLLEYSPAAKETYAKEVSSLNSKLNIAKKNSPLERSSQMIAYTRVKAKSQKDQDLTKSEKKKLSQRELAAARVEVGAKRHPIEINDREWEAIQSGAISDNKLKEILNYTNTDTLRERATPRTRKELSTAKQNKIKSMDLSGYTNAEIADSLGVSVSTVSKYLNS